MSTEKPQEEEANNDFSWTHSTSLIKKIDKIDKKYSEMIHLLEVNKVVEVFLYICARFYNPECVTVYFILMLAYQSIIKQDYFFVCKPILHVLIMLLITLLMKCVIARQRPALKDNVKRIFNVRNREKNCSMPSGDAMQAANFSVVMICYLDNYWAIYLIPFVMISRIFYWCHYITDTVVGALIGGIVSYCLYILLK